MRVSPAYARALEELAAQRTATLNPVTPEPSSTALCWTLWLPGWMPHSLNQAAGRHWSQGAKLKKRDREVVAGACRVYAVPPATRKRRLVTFIVLGPAMRRPDRDNLLKTLLDACVACGLLWGDSPDRCEWEPPRYARGEVAGTFLHVEEL